MLLFLLAALQTMPPGTRAQHFPLLNPVKPVERRVEVSEPAVQEIDDAVRAVMNQYGVPGAALAIVKDARLVYVQGYTASGVPGGGTFAGTKVQPATYFRLASVSKTFAAIELYRLLQERNPGLTHGLDTLVSEILQSKLTGKVAPRFYKVTVGELLSHSSGINPATMVADVAATQLAHHPLPMSVTDAVQYIASQKLLSDPGAVYSYNDAGYFLLGAVDTQLRGQEFAPLGFVSSMLEDIFLPLHLGRVRPAAELIGDQPPDEARYATYGNRAPSVMSADQPQVDDNYGDESLAVGLGAKGLSASVVDVARILATFSKLDAHPILNPATRTLMFQNGIATKAASASGSDERSGHGFDDVTSAGNDEYHAQKGGQFNTSQDMIYLETEKGGISYVICWAGAAAGDWYPKWTELLAPARKRDWHGVDLFPRYLVASPFTGPGIGPIKTQRLGNGLGSETIEKR